MQLIWKRLRLFRIIASANQLSLHGAVAEMCDEYETLHDRLGQPVVVGQSSSSLVLSVIKTEVPLDCDDLAKKDLLLQQYGERIEKLSQQDKLSKLCMVNKLLQEKKKKHHNQKDGSKGTPKLGPYWKLQPASCTVNMELRSEFRLWIETILTLGSEFLTALITNMNSSEQETLEVQFQEYALKLDAKDFACRSKTKAKPQRREPAGSSPRTVLIGKRPWTDVEPWKYSFSDYEVSKKVAYLLVMDNMCMEKKMEQFNSGESKKVFKIFPVLPSLVW